MHHEAARVQTSVPVGLRSAQYVNVFKAAVLVQRHNPAGLKADQRSRMTMIILAIKPMNIHSKMKWLPLQMILILGKTGEIWKNEQALSAFAPR